MKRVKKSHAEDGSSLFLARLSLDRQDFQDPVCITFNAAKKPARTFLAG